MKPGLYCHYEVTKNGEVISIDEWVSSPLNVKAITSSIRGDDFGRLLHFIDSHGKWHEWAMPMYLLKGSGEELRGELLNQGLIFNTAKHGRILEFIMTERPTQRIIAASKVGWHENTFILPNQVIGKLAIEYGLLPWDKNTALDAATIAFIRWQHFQGASQTEDMKILRAINDFINKHGDSRFSLISPYEPDNKSVNNRAGWYKDTDKQRVFMFSSTGLQEASGGYDKSRVIDTLIRHGWIIDKDSGRHTKKTRTPSGNTNLYHICLPE